MEARGFRVTSRPAAWTGEEVAMFVAAVAAWSDIKKRAEYGGEQNIHPHHWLSSYGMYGMRTSKECATALRKFAARVPPFDNLQPVV